MHRSETPTVPDEDYDHCEDDTQATNDATVTSISKSADDSSSNAQQVIQEAKHEVAEAVEAGAVTLEGIALTFGCNARMQQHIDSALSSFSETMAKASDAAAEQAAKANDIAQSNFLIAWSAISELASQVFGNLAEEEGEIESTADAVAERAAHVASAAAAVTTDSNGRRAPLSAPLERLTVRE